jgi:general secretion pathway protein I
MRARLNVYRGQGFTMIEVLVALTIIAIALAASIRAVGGLAVQGVELHERLLAGFSADNALAQLRLQHAWPEPGTSSFDCPQGALAMRCTLQVSATPNPIFRRVEVTVTQPDRRGELAHLVTVFPNETNRPL